MTTLTPTDRKMRIAFMLRQIADDVEASSEAPAACFVQIFMDTRSVLRMRKILPDFNWLVGVGVFETVKSELIDEIRRGDEDIADVID